METSSISLEELMQLTFPAWSWQGFATTIICMVIYFVSEYKTKSTAEGFSLNYWVKDNVWNVVLSISLFLLYNIVSPSLLLFAIVALSTSPNLIIDWIQSYMFNKKQGQIVPPIVREKDN